MAKKPTNEEAFARFDRDGDGRPGGSLPKGEKTMAKATTRRKPAAKSTKAAGPRKRGDQTPEAQPTAKKASAAADRMFKDADADAAGGLAREQRENQVRKAALGW